MSQKNGQTVRRASRQPPRVSRAKDDAKLQRGVRPGPGCGAAARARGLREKARRAHIKDTVRRARVSRSPPACPASLVRVDLLLGSGRRPALTPAGRGRSRSLASRAAITTPPSPPLTDHRELKDDAVRAGGSPLPDYDAVPVRRAPLPPRAALARFFPSSSPTLGVSLPSSRADRAAPNPPDASPRPHLTRRRRSAVSEPGSDPVACGSATSTFRATSVATRACATSSKSLSGTRATGVGSSPHAAHGDEQLCHLRLRSDETRAPDGTVTLGLSFSVAGDARMQGLMTPTWVCRGGARRSPEEDFWQDATPENTFTLRVASCAPRHRGATARGARPRRAVRSGGRLARLGFSVVLLPEVFAALATIDRDAGYVEAAVPNHVRGASSAEVVSSQPACSLPDRVRRGCAARPMRARPRRAGGI